MDPICHRVAFREVFKRKSGNAWIQEVCNEDCNKKVIGKRNHNLNIADHNHNHCERNIFRFLCDVEFTLCLVPCQIYF